MSSSWPDEFVRERYAGSVSVELELSAERQNSRGRVKSNLTKSMSSCFRSGVRDERPPCLETG